MRGISYYPHHLLIRDRVRTVAFGNAIRALLPPAGTVADLGAGSGILSLLAATAGASRVVSVELSQDMSTFIRHLAYENGYGDVVEVHNENAIDLSLRNFADLLVCDAMGFFGASEEMEVLLNVRDKWLRPGGKITPEAVSLIAAPLCTKAVHDWLNINEGSLYELNLDLANEIAFNSVHSIIAEPSNYLSEPKTVQFFDLKSASDCRVSFNATWTVESSGLLHGLGGWYSAHLAPGITLTNGPEAWRPMARARFFPLAHPPAVEEADVVVFEVACSPVLAFWSCSVFRQGERIFDSHQTSLDRESMRHPDIQSMNANERQRRYKRALLLDIDLVARGLLTKEEFIRRYDAAISEEVFSSLLSLMENNSMAHNSGVFAGLA